MKDVVTLSGEKPPLDGVVGSDGSVTIFDFDGYGALSAHVLSAEATKDLEIQRLRRALAEAERKNQKLEELNITDPLTGVFNRRYLECTVTKMVAAQKRRKAPWGILMIDIDYFKQFNDRYGHPVGDEALKAVAQKLQKISREGDVAVRYGGEEFLIAVFDINEKDLENLAERYRSAIADMKIEIDEGTVFVTVSIGVCFVPGDSSMESLDSVVRLADAALYNAKNSGRNQVKIARDQRKAVRGGRHEDRREAA